MQAAAPHGASLILTLHRVAIHAIVVADFLYSSRLYRAVLPDIAQRVLLLTLVGFNLLYFGFALLRGHVIPVLVTVLAGSLIIGQMLVFEYNWGMEPNITGVGQYSVIFSFITFFIVSRDGLSTYAVKILFRYALVYVTIYLVLVLGYFLGLLPPQISTPLLYNDVERGDRFFAYAGALAFCWFLALARARERLSVPIAALLLVCALANLLTLSRVYLLSLSVVTALTLAGASRRLIRTVCVGALFLLTGVLTYGFIDPSWNPFFVFSSGDTSGFGRALEYQIAQDLLASTPLFGLGLSSLPEQPGLLTGIPFFSPGDFGATGMWFGLGMLGLGLFLVSSLISCSHIRLLPASYADALFCVGCTLAFDGWLVPALFSPDGTFYFAAILGMWLAQEIRVSPTRRLNETATPRIPMPATMPVAGQSS